MRIPKTYNLYNLQFKVEFNKDLFKKEDFWGKCCFRETKIILDETIKEWNKWLEQTFCHELTHSILFAMKENELSNNEKFVDNFAHLLYQALDTMEY